MGVALYVVLDLEDPGFDATVDGKAIGKAADKLNAICQSVGLPSLDSFVSMSMDEVADMLGEDIPEIEEAWFDADTGLDYFDKLAAHLKANPASLAKTDAALEDIADYVSVLRQAKAAGAKWRLSVDI